MSAAVTVDAHGRKATPIIDDEEESDDFEVAPKPKSKAAPKKAAPEGDVESISNDDDFTPVRTASGRIIKSPRTLASEVMPKDKSKSGSSKGSKAQNREASVVEEVPADENPQFDPAALEGMSKEYPDAPTTVLNLLTHINKDNPLTTTQSLMHPGYVHGMTISDDGELMATASTMGTVRIWDLRKFALLQELRDMKEENIEEFYVARFSPDSKFLITAGKLKLRDQWNEEEADNQITPGPVKIFDTLTGEVVARLEGHTEEILHLERVKFKGQNFLITCSQDGRIIKWPMNDTWSGLAPGKRARFISDLTSYYVFSLSFMPSSGNKYFVGACDDGVKVYDFESGQLLHSFAELFSCYCDCVQFASPSSLPKEKGLYYLLVRGVELLKDDTNRTIKPNTIRLYRFRIPQTADAEWPPLELLQTYEDKEYFSNSWPTKIASNGEYVFGPSSFGEVFVWRLVSAQLTATLVEHKEREVRDVVLHPTRPLLFSCGHDSQIRVYSPAEKPPPSAAAPTTEPKTKRANGSKK